MICRDSIRSRRALFSRVLYTVTLLKAVVCTLPAAALAGDGETRKRPNVLLIMADDLNTALGCYGHPVVKTPHLDRLASRGVRFENAYCQAPLCNGSRASFFSGLRPTTIHVLDNETAWPPRLEKSLYMPRYFQTHGYFTATIGKVLDHKRVPKQPYWDLEIPEWGKAPPEEQIAQRGLLFPGGTGSKYWAKLTGPEEMTPDGDVAKRAVQALEERAKESKPWFVAVGFRRPHTPFAAPSRYFDLYPPEQLTLPTLSAGYRGTVPAAALVGWVLKPDDARQALSAYYACVSYVDAQLGVLLDTLDRLELWDESIVIFASDHGFHTGHHGIWSKGTLFEQTIRAPLIVAAPGKRPGVCRRIVELLDLYPTLSELCEGPIPEGLEGKSLVPLLDDPHRPWEKVALTTLGRVDENNRRTFTGRSIRTARYRYTQWDEGKQGTEFYDFANDRHGLKNLIAVPDYAPMIDRLRILLRAN